MRDELVDQSRSRLISTELLQTLAPKLDGRRDAVLVGSLMEAESYVFDHPYLDPAVLHRRSARQSVDRAWEVTDVLVLALEEGARSPDYDGDDREGDRTDYECADQSQIRFLSHETSPVGGIHRRG